MDGILLVNKPVGLTSYDVVRRIKRRFEKKIKVGHAGSLDPFAQGLLIITVGRATKLFDSFQKLNKGYNVVAEFGYETDSYDSTGSKTVLDDSNYLDLTEVDIKVAFKKFLGEISQVPPKYSAKKIKGKKACDLARSGKEVILEPTKIHVYNLELFEFKIPFFKVFIECSKGTYVRSLVVDIARELGSYATSVELVRLFIGDYKLEDSIELEDIVLERDLINLDGIKL